jgi:hypothetical protein
VITFFKRREIPKDTKLNREKQEWAERNGM